MSETGQKQQQSAELGKSPEVKLNNTNPKGAGRRSKEYYTKPVQEILNLTALTASRILQDYIERRKGAKQLSRDFIEACKYVIDHAIGKARQKIEHSGGILTYRALADGADELDKKPRPFLADTEELGAPTNKPSKN